ncbi:MAG: AzlC family ABC transporter permease [Clostridia bacterium]|nr:AzlC family ABC transporter permease [Clostridia bacterium]
MDESSYQNNFKQGLRDGVPIGLGYLSVSFTFGMMAVAAGMPALCAILISMTTLTSAGQFAGLSMIVASAGYLEIALTQLVINIRYSLMSLSLSQKLDRKLKTLPWLGISFGITDEIFAVASTKSGRVGSKYMTGLIAVPYIGWALGTALGALAGSFLPAMVQSALGIAIYGMFIAIIVPAAKKSFPVFLVTAVAVILSCLFRFVPGLNQVSGGFVIIICSVAAAGIGSLCFPKKEELL